LILTASLVALVCLVLGIAATSQNLTQVQNWILILFLIFFATFGFGISVWFILVQARRISIEKDNRAFDWKATLPENQRRKLENEVLELAGFLKISQDQYSDLLSAYILAENFALRQIQQEFRQPLTHYVSIGDADFSAILLKGDLIICAEVLFIVKPEIEQDKIEDVLEKTGSAQKTLLRLGRNANIRLLLVLVTQLDREGEARLRSALAKQFATTPVDVDIRLFDFETLQKIYAVE